MEDVGPTSLGSSWSAPVDQLREQRGARPVHDLQGGDDVTRRLNGVVAVAVVGCLLTALPATGLAKGVSSCDARADHETLVANRGVRIFQRQD
jgi:hypothetical protein